MKHAVAIERVMRLHRAGSVPVQTAKRYLEAFTPEEQEAIVRQLEGGERLAHDPQQEDPEKGPIIRDVLNTTRAEVSEQHDERIAQMVDRAPELARMLASCGLVHRIESEAKRRLLAEHGIVYRTVAEMNPWCCID